jgi:serine/threonine protein kinase
MPNDFILMLEQMVARRYTIPPELGLSEDCCNLLRRMLMPEPHKRIAMADILAHRWFNTNLPPDVVHMNAKYLGLPRLAGVPSPAAIQELLDAAHTPTATGSSSGEPGRGSGGSDSGGGGTSERAVQQQPPGDGAAARMPPPEHMQMSATHEALGGSAPAVAAATPPGGGRQQQQQQQLMGSSGPDSASACGVMEVDASIPSNEGLPSLPHEMSHELQAYVKASEAGWS